MAYRVIFDNFSDVYEFRRAIQTRPENKHCKHEAKNGSKSFAGMPLEKAYEALTDGLPEVVERLKKEVTKFQVTTAGNLNQRRPINYYNGHSPNVPAAIIGLPKSMRKVTKTPSKVKTVTLFFNTWVCCGVDAKDFEKSGFTVYQLVYWLEKCGYRVRLTVIPVCCESNGDRNECAVCSVLLKDFRQPLDMLKLSFSIASISMWRRLGFRWIETVSGLESSWYAYGQKISKEKSVKVFEQAGHSTENAYFIMHEDCERVGYDPIKLADYLGIKVG